MMGARNSDGLAYTQPGRLVSGLALLGACASVGVLPYATALHPATFERVAVPLPVFYLVQFLQALVILSLLAWCGLRVGRRLGFIVAWPREGIRLSIIAGAIVAFVIIVLDQTLFQKAAGPDIALWKRLLACFYGGITEEIICRLFLTTVIVWLCAKLAAKDARGIPQWAYWTGIIGAALLFGLGHLPAAAALWPITLEVVVKILLLNGIAGIVFGWLYWRFGLAQAIVAHLSADLVLHVISAG